MTLLLMLSSTDLLRAWHAVLCRLDVRTGWRVAIAREVYARWTLEQAQAEARDWWAT
jgi:hypothetical protein